MIQVQVFKLKQDEKRLNYRVIVTRYGVIEHDKSFRTEKGKDLFLKMVRESIYTGKSYNELVIENLMKKKKAVANMIKAENDEERDIIYEMNIGFMYTGNSEGKSLKSKEHSIKSNHQYDKLLELLSGKHDIRQYESALRNYLFELDAKAILYFELDRLL